VATSLEISSQDVVCTSHFSCLLHVLLIILDLINLIKLVGLYKLISYSVCNVLQSLVT